MTFCGYDEAYHRIRRGKSERLWLLDDRNGRTRVFAWVEQNIHFKSLNGPINPRAYGSYWPSPSEIKSDMISQASQLAKKSAAGVHPTSVLVCLPNTRVRDSCTLNPLPRGDQTVNKDLAHKPINYTPYYGKSSQYACPQRCGGNELLAVD